LKEPKKVAPKKPAAPVTQNDKVRPIEQGFREYTHLLKKYQIEGIDAVASELERSLADGFDPSNASMSASGVILAIGATMAWGEKFDHPRRRGAVDDLGKLLLQMVEKEPRISTPKAWNALRAMAEMSHPVVQDVDDDHIYYRSGGKERRPLTKKGFESRMTQTRKRANKFQRE
jgi:hypothetical protein